MTITLTQADWFGLLTHFLSLSLLAVGGRYYDRTRYAALPG